MTDFVARLRLLPADTLTALAFFSRLPVTAPAGSFDLHRSAAAWPIAGLILALAPAALLLVARLAYAPSLVAALLALALLAALTGAMHEDGLADTADGFGGGRKRDDKLAVMRDSRLGTYGALALFFSLAVRAAALAALAFHPALAALALLLVAVLSRVMALWHWNATLPARRDGLAWGAGRPDWLALATALLIGLVAALLLLACYGLAALIGMLLAALGIALFSSLCRRQIGGHTGDTIGAAQQIAETFLLAGLSAGWPALVT
jgi:adenosylcobinamide-GDP ribazoletransferase